MPRLAKSVGLKPVESATPNAPSTALEPTIHISGPNKKRKAEPNPHEHASQSAPIATSSTKRQKKRNLLGMLCLYALAFADIGN
jgi:hypothetical protein